MPEYSDSVIGEIRRVRHEISRSEEHDVRKLAERLKNLESQFKRPPLDYGDPKPKKKAKRVQRFEPETVA